MAKDETKKLSRLLLQKDRDAFAALSLITGYAPADKNFSIANGKTAAEEMDANHDTEAQTVATLKNVKDDTKASEWAFHNFMLGVKNQVAAQFGDDSNEYQSLGLKKKSEKKKPTFKKAQKTIADK